MGTVLEYTEEQFHSVFQHMQQCSQFQRDTCFCSLMNLKCPHWQLVWKTSVSMNLDREALSLGSLSTPIFLVEQQSGQLSHCHIDVRSVLELWLSCPDQVFLERKSPGPFCCPAFQDHSKTCFHLDAFVSMVSPGLFVPCQPGMTFLLRCFSVCPLLCCCLQGSVWKVNTVHPTRCPVSPEGLMLCAGDTNLVVFMKAPQIAITASEINK